MFLVIGLFVLMLLALSVAYAEEAEYRDIQRTLEDDEQYYKHLEE